MIGTEYMGLELKSPVIVSSGPLTQNIVSLKKAEEAGAGAVVLKSIFEEQIEADVSSELEGNAEYLAHSSAEEFSASSSRDYYIDRYMKLLTEAKCLLARKSGMSEAEAHSYIEKKAMNCRISLSDAAMGIVRELS